MGKNFRETLNERMQDPAFRAEWDAQEPERQIMRAIVEGREENGMTQKQLSDITGITQADISRLESGTANPSLRTLKRLAAGMGMALRRYVLLISNGPGARASSSRKSSDKGLLLHPRLCAQRTRHIVQIPHLVPLVGGECDLLLRTTLTAAWICDKGLHLEVLRCHQCTEHTV